jgi:hypothetical protein
MVAQRTIYVGMAKQPILNLSLLYRIIIKSQFFGEIKRRVRNTMDTAEMEKIKEGGGWTEAYPPPSLRLSVGRSS